MPLPPPYLAAGAAVAGLAVSSYVTVLVTRVPAGATLGILPGQCPRCGCRLRGADMVPVAGWLWLRGRCRSCRAPFGRWYLAAELVTAAVFAVMGVRFGLSPVLPAYLFLAALGVALAFIDAFHHRLPDLLTLPSYPVALGLLAVAAPFVPGGGSRLLHAVIGMAAALVGYLLLAVVSPGGIGWGDVKLSGLVGAYLGWLGAAAFLAGLLAGWLLAGVAGIVLLLAGRATRRSQLAFGPFMLAGALLAIAASGL